MGFNTTVLILNDAWHNIVKDKDFGQKLYDAMYEFHRTQRPADVSSSGHANAATVVETHHADEIHLIAVGGNCAKDLGYCGSYRSSEIDQLKALADKLGYQISKKRVAPRKLD